MTAFIACSMGCPNPALRMNFCRPEAAEVLSGIFPDFEKTG
jgi:hypothetical protein